MSDSREVKIVGGVGFWLMQLCILLFVQALLRPWIDTSHDRETRATLKRIADALDRAYPKSPPPAQAGENEETR